MFAFLFLSSVLLASSPEELLSQMTLREKAAQMTLVERGNVKQGDIMTYALGGVLSGGGSVPDQNDPEGWVELINGFLNESAQTRLKIPIIYGIEAAHGNNNVLGATIFPHNVNYGATAVGDETIGMKNVGEEGAAVREETKAVGIPWIFGPLLASPQDVRWGSSNEAYSENISIVTLLAPEFIKAVQATNEVTTTMKHYLAEGQTVNGKQSGDAPLSNEELRGLLSPYAAAIKAGSNAVMTAYNTINGAYCTENSFILTTLLKEELSFRGAVVSEWGAVNRLPGDDYKEKLARAINAGVDFVMATVNGHDGWVATIDAILSNVEDGSINLSRLDDAVLRILRLKERVGLLANNLPPRVPGEIGTPAHRELARSHAADSIVLLKNSNRILVRFSSFTNFLVAGQGADDIGMQCGGWTLSWQGAHGATVPGTSLLDGFRSVQGKNFTYSENATADGRFDAAIVVVGENPYAEDGGDLTGNNSLRERDQVVLTNAYKLGVPVIVIILSGRPIHILDEAERWTVAIWAGLPGSEAGSGIADVLFGDRDFVARLPNAWRSYLGGNIIFPYGHGLTKDADS